MFSAHFLWTTSTNSLSTHFCHKKVRWKSELNAFWHKERHHPSYHPPLILMKRGKGFSLKHVLPPLHHLQWLCQMSLVYLLLHRVCCHSSFFTFISPEKWKEIIWRFCSRITWFETSVQLHSSWWMTRAKCLECEEKCLFFTYGSFGIPWFGVEMTLLSQHPYCSNELKNWITFTITRFCRIGWTPLSKFALMTHSQSVRSHFSPNYP